MQKHPLRLEHNRVPFSVVSVLFSSCFCASFACQAHFDQVNCLSVTAVFVSTNFELKSMLHHNQIQHFSDLKSKFYFDFLDFKPTRID